MNVPWTDRVDLHLSVIDSDSASGTFNTILRTFDAGINDPNDGLTLDLMTTSPDGKFAYLWYDDFNPMTGRDPYYLGIFNLTTGVFTSMSADSLAVTSQQSQVYVSPDGKSLLLALYIGAQTRIRVFDISNPVQPKRIGDLSQFLYPATDCRACPLSDRRQSTVRNRCQRDHGSVQFRPEERQTFVSVDIPSFKIPTHSTQRLPFSADGAYMYVTDSFNNQVTVFDTSKLGPGRMYC